MGRNVLVIGAGRSSSSLIRYLLQNAQEMDVKILVGDMDVDLAKSKVNGHPRGESFLFNAMEEEARRKVISSSSLVISMLPARWHFDVAKDCIEMGIPIITPSYVSPEMQELNEAAKAKGVLLLNEIGVDPGIDHMSAMRIIDDLRAKGAEITRFESFTGGLVAPESDDNPWHYKFTWNPRNVVLAGQGGSAMFQQENRLKYIPPYKVFQRIKEIKIQGHGLFEGYANRDSLKYKKIYGLEGISTIYRGTLRKSGFCAAWDVFVQLGMTLDDYKMEASDQLTNRQFVNAFLPFDELRTVEEKLQGHLDLSDEIMEKLAWLDLFKKTPVELKDASPAQILQAILERKWGLAEHDKDMIVMWHRFDYTLNGKTHELHSSMVAIGEDQIYTSMSNTVGLPVAIAAKMILQGKLSLTGVQLPTSPLVYNPILDELNNLGIQFIEHEV
jgi:saccharopine dehydrogenase-like NADP-dependent oxidoreductase